MSDECSCSNFPLSVGPSSVAFDDLSSPRLGRRPAFDIFTSLCSRTHRWMQLELTGGGVSELDITGMRNGKAPVGDAWLEEGTQSKSI